MLPCEDQMAETPHSSIARAEDETLASGRATILFVEDDRMLRHAISTMLRIKGFSVLEANDGSIALDAIRTQKDIDVLLLDISLPGASSREVYEEARRLRPNLHLIITSAYSKEMAEASLGRTVERFLRKPFGVRDLIKMIREFSVPDRAGSVA
jgi:two-component system, cell cycle sensor histidine kinase and response regulator CckA